MSSGPASEIEQQCFLAIRNLPLPVLLVNPESFVVPFRNQAASEIFYPRYEEADGPAEVPGAVAAQLRDFLETDEPEREFPLEVKPEGDRQYHFAVKMRKLTNATGPAGILVTFSDFTAAKEMESRIEVLHTNLAARALELEMANQELESFNYTVSHDLKSPLTGICGYSQIMLKNHADALDDSCVSYLQEILDSGKRMNQLIDTLLDFSRLNNLTLSRTTVDLSAVAAGVMKRLETSQPYRAVTFRNGQTVPVEADPDLMLVVMENLLGNAWKFTAARKDALIEFGLDDAGGTRTYFVRDNGPGFDMAVAQKLFIPFYRQHSAERFDGFGIGLATVERIIRRHGGKVKAAETPGGGATFSFTIGEPRE